MITGRSSSMARFNWGGSKWAQLLVQGSQSLEQIQAPVLRSPRPWDRPGPPAAAGLSAWLPSAGRIEVVWHANGIDAAGKLIRPGHWIAGFRQLQPGVEAAPTHTSFPPALADVSEIGFRKLPTTRCGSGCRIKSTHLRKGLDDWNRLGLVAAMSVGAGRADGRRLRPAGGVLVSDRLA